MLRKPRSHSQVNPASTDVEADSWARPLLCPKLRELSGNVHCWLLYEGLAIYFPFPTFNSFFFFFFKFLVVLVFTAGHRLSQLAESGDFSHRGGGPCYRAPARDTQVSAVVAHRLNCPIARGVFQTRNQICVPCTDRLLNRWTPSEVPPT